MNVSLEKTGASAVVTVKIEKADYADAVKKELKHIASQVEMPGFRKGKAPKPFVEKRYGLQTKMEQVDKLINSSLTNYIKENNLEILGEPMVSEKQPELDIVKGDDFEFVFDVALAPEFDITLDSNDHVDFYDIEVTDEQIQEQVEMFTRQAGHHENVEEYADRDIIRGVLAEQDAEGNPLENGIHVEKASLMPTYFKDEAQKALFEGAKVGSVITMNPALAHGEEEAASLLRIKKEEVADHKGNFTFQVEEISRFVPAELNQEFFDSVFEDGEVTTEEQFRNKVGELLKTQRVADADYKYLQDLRKHCEEKVGELEYNRELLKKFMVQNMKKDEKEHTEEAIEKEFEASLKGLKWHLIREKLVKAFDIKVSQDEVREQAIKMARVMFLRYGMPNVPEEYVTQYADKMMEDQEQLHRIIDQCVDASIVENSKKAVTLEHKSIALADFQKFFAPEAEA